MNWDKKTKMDIRDHMRTKFRALECSIENELSYYSECFSKQELVKIKRLQKTLLKLSREIKLNA